MSSKKTRKITTIHFGELKVEQNHVFTFQEGLFGFEDLREFVLVSEEETLPFRWLISMESPEIGFPLLSPWLIDLNYRPGKELEKEENVLFAIITLEDEEGNMTANLKAPIILDVQNQTGRQVILTWDKYLTNHVVTQNKKEKHSLV